MTPKRIFKSLKNGKPLIFYYQEYTICIEQVKGKFQLHTYVFDGGDLFEDENYFEERIRTYVNFDSLINIIEKEFPTIIEKSERNSVLLKGFRKIRMDDSVYFWKFNEKIIVVNQSIKNSYLTVDIGWFDEALYLNDPENRPPAFDIKKVTPKFVAKCIKYALSKGWNEGKMEIKYHNGEFEE